MNENAYREVAILKKEVSKLEHQNVEAIESLETELSGLVEVFSVVDDQDWSPRLDNIEIFTMEELPPLKDSIRQIQINEKDCVDEGVSFD